MAYALKNNQITELEPDEEPDVELRSPATFFGSHVNLIPVQNAVQGPRLFYGARFINQALPLDKPEAPWVQNLLDDDSGRSFDEQYGKSVGAVFAEDDDDGAEVVDADGDRITLKRPDGTTRAVSLYKNFPFNRKSVSGKTIVTIRRNREVMRPAIEDYVFEDGDQTLSHDPIKRKSSWKPVLGYLKHTNDKKLFEVVTESGRKVVVTEDHSLVTMGDGWDLVPLLPGECEIGVSRLPLVFAKYDSMDDGWTREQGILDGLYLAEGCHEIQKGLLSIAVDPPDRVLQVRQLVRDLRGVEPHNSSENCHFTDYELKDRWLKDFGKHAGGKFIADHVFNRSKTYLRGVLSGYISGDGCNWTDKGGAMHLSGVSTSKSLRDSLVFLMQTLGILATEWDAPRAYINDNWNDAYGFRVISAHMFKLPPLFYNDRQLKFKDGLKALYRATVFEGIPVYRALRKSLYKSFNGKVPHYIYKTVCGRSAVPKRRLLDTTEAVKDWALSDIMWDTVMSVTQVDNEEFVYDLCVADSETFAVGEGLLVHNTAISTTSALVKGDKITKGQLLARSNYTDDKGVLAMGTNAKVGLVPYKGWSMDDAVVISEGFARKLSSDHSYTEEQEFDNDTKPGRNHFISLFPDKFTKKQMEPLDDRGVIKPGTVLKFGDPMILATKPKAFSSSATSMGKLSKVMRQARADASTTWDHEETGLVTDVANTKQGVKVVVKSIAPTKKGDKIVFRSGQKGIVSKIIPDEHMPRTVNGDPLEVLLNPLGIPSRVNNSLIYELLLGKIAKKNGAPIKLPGFNSHGSKRYEEVMQLLDEAGLSDLEEIFDPTSNKKLENPVTVGDAYVLKLHHTAASKTSARSQGSYTLDEQPSKGGGVGAQCFIASQTINTADGPCNIGRICEKRLRKHVLSWHEKNQEWVYRPIVDWFIRRASIDELITVKFSGPCDRRSGVDSRKDYNQAALHLTKGHEVYTPNGKVQVGRLTVGDELLVRGPVITKDQRSLLVGTMLGDGYVHKDGDNIRCEHSLAQLEFVKWKHDILSGLGSDWFTDYSHKDARTGKTHRSCAVTLGLPYVTNWAREFFYSTGSKAVTREWIDDIDDLALATWVLDDGSFYWSPSKGKYCVEIATCSFSEEEANMLLQHLADRFDIHMTRNSKGSLVGPSKDTWLKVAAVVASVVPWEVIPKSKKALVAYCEAVQSVNPVKELKVENKLGRVPVRIRSIEPYVHDKPGVTEINVYDFTVEETHNYCASYISVSNSKRFSGLEVHSMLSAGAYATLREGSTLRGQRNDEYWRQLRAGLNPHPPGEPFVWNKFRALLEGSGMSARTIGGGKMRLGPMTDDELETRKPIEVRNGKMVDMGTMEPEKDGLFDSALVGSDKWGKIKLPQHMPNPAFEAQIAKLLGVTKDQLREVIAGRLDLPDRK